MRHLSASIIAADFTRLGSEIESALAAGMDSIHFDVMDHHYVPNLSIGAMVCQSIHQHFPDIFVDVHLMVTNPDDHLEPFVQAGVRQISVHPETCPDLEKTWGYLQQQNVKKGVVINPGQMQQFQTDWLSTIDHVLMMSVHPGFAGQSFIAETLNDVATMRQLIHESGRQITLGMDGGISNKVIGECAHAGADFFVVGSHLFHAEDYTKIVSALRQ